MIRTNTTVEPHPQFRLRVIRPEEEKQYSAQDCSICRNQRNCWAPKIKEEHILTNLLVCRIKRGIDVNRSSVMFLQLVRPKLKTYSKRIQQSARIDRHEVMTDLESATIETIHKLYVLGGVGFPLHFLFSPKMGHIRFFAINYVKKLRKFGDFHSFGDEVSVGSEGTQVEDMSWNNSPGLVSKSWNSHYDPRDETDETDIYTQRVRAIVDDGLTLNLSEYKTLKFCLDNAGKGKKPFNGLHLYLAKQMNVNRARISVVSSEAIEKVKVELSA